jgi:hypothetical protein
MKKPGDPLPMNRLLSRRSFAGASAGVLVSGTAVAGEGGKAPVPMPTEAPFERDYPPPEFRPSWKRPQINRLLLQDFVIYAHTDLAMVKKLLAKEPGLVVASINWGADDWESGLGAAAHMGRRDIVEYLLEQGARVDIFCAAMLGLKEVVQAFLMLQPKLIDAKGPHGFSLHFHAQVGGKAAEPVLEYLQSIKKIDLKPNPFLPQKNDKPGPPSVKKAGPSSAR